MRNNVSFESSLPKFGVGLFETIRVEKHPLDLELHMNRMYNSINELGLNIRYDKDFLIKEILKYIIENNIDNKALRITVFDEGFNISTRSIVYDEKSYEKGFKLMISPIKRGDSIIYKHKTTNYFENIYTKNNANINGFDDGIFINTDDVVLECSMSNIFFVKNDTIFTPKSELPILNGIMKKRITELCEELNINMIEKEIKVSEIEKFNYAFLSNSLMKVMKVTQIENITYERENEIFNKVWREINDL